MGLVCIFSAGVRLFFSLFLFCILWPHVHLQQCEGIHKQLAEVLVSSLHYSIAPASGGVSSSQTNAPPEAARSRPGSAQRGISPIQPDETEATSVLKVGHQHSRAKASEETEGFLQAEAHFTPPVR